MTNTTRLARALLGLVVLSGSATAQNKGVGPDEASGVNSHHGDESPTSGLSAGQTNSRLDDYSNQDEQINLDADSGTVKVLRVNQKNLIHEYVTATIPLTHANPRELRDVMRTVTGKEGGRAEVILDEKTGENYLQVICPAFMVESLREAVGKLDVDWLAQDRDGSATGQWFTLYRPAETLDAIASRYAGEGATFVDRARNIVTRRDEPYRVDEYLAACDTFDLPPPQAHLKFTIYEVDTSNDLKLGVDWIAWKNGPGRSLFEVLFAGQNSHHQFDNATGFFDPNLGAFTAFSNGNGSIGFKSTQHLLSANYLLTSAFLDFLRVKGKARVLAEPELYAFSGVTATWSSVDQFLSFESAPVDPGTNGAVPTRLNFGSDFSAHDRFMSHGLRTGNEVGLFLKVRSVVGTETSEVEVDLDSSAVAGTTPQGTPILTTRRIVTKLRLANGQPFVLGGLTRTEEIESNQKAPWLGDIPILGYLFGQETSSARRKELVITAIPRFYQGAPKEITDAVTLDTLAMASGAQEIEVPETSYGFDQWLFDTVEKP